VSEECYGCWPDSDNGTCGRKKTQALALGKSTGMFDRWRRFKKQTDRLSESTAACVLWAVARQRYNDLMAKVDRLYTVRRARMRRCSVAA
jgi:hypothetical protein